MDMGGADFAPCKRCTKQIPTEATRCPNCGYEPAARARPWRTLVLVFAAVVFVVAVVLLGVTYGILGVFVGALVGLGLVSPILLAVSVSVLRDQEAKPTTRR
jgi:hypothetical protein